MTDRWIWPFELEEKIGEGGMGVVYRGRYVKNDRKYAVKLLPIDVTDRVILARFEREMKALKSLKHPNIVRCFGGVCEDKQRFYAMELVEAGTLKTLLEERGRLSWEQVIEFGLQMCEALDYAHNHGIVHRDVKPGNFLITPDGRLKLSDFGLISLHARSNLTAEGKTLGTFRYMAPEQIRGKPEPSPQTDLYGLGCVFFEMLTGDSPFLGETPAETLHKHLKEQPPEIGPLAPDCPPALAALVRDLLQKDVSLRPASAAEVADRLTEIPHSMIVETGRREVIRQQPPATRDSSPRRQWRTSPVTGWLLLASILLVFLLSVQLTSMNRTIKNLDSAVDLWIEAYIENPSPEVRVEAARTLGKLTPHSEKALDALIAGLQEQENTQVREETVVVLGKAGHAARPALSELIDRQNGDERPTVRQAAARAIKAIRAAEEPSSPLWRYLLTLCIAVAIVYGGWKLLTKPADDE